MGLGGGAHPTQVLDLLIWHQCEIYATNAAPQPGGPPRKDTCLKPERNAPCPCGSGEKYKRCCGSIAAPGKAPGAVGAPSGPQTLFARGVQLLRAGQPPAALPLLAAAIEADPGHFDAHLALGAAFIQTGQIANATEMFCRAVALRPDAAAAYRDLGAAYDHQNLHEQAIDAFQHAAALEPRHIEIHLRLAQLYTMYSRMEEAANSLERAADIKPKTTAARLYRSDASLLRGDVNAAEEWARKAVTLEPASDAANGTLAGLLYTQGRFDEAAARFDAALRTNPKSTKCWDGLVRCRKYTIADDAILERMDAVLQRRDLADPERTTIHFAMGKVQDDRGNYAQAMEQFEQGNRLRAKGLTFDRAGLAALVDRSIELFTPDFIARKAAHSAQTSKPIFIVGMYRSGTTLVEQVLSSHPDIAAGGELTVWAPGDIEINPPANTFDPDRTHAAITKYLSVLQNIGPSAARVTDKLPTNFFRLGEIACLLPNARIIHCQRDPIDTCLSIYTTYFSSRVPYAARKDDLVFCYQQYLRIMDHWRKVLPANALLEIQYEALIADREAETRRLIAFTGLDWDESCLQPEQNKRPISTSSAWQARQPVYTNSVQRWLRYEPWLGALAQLR